MGAGGARAGEANSTGRSSSSIGYSACHWCHVMEHESFEDEATAQVLNEHFVCIKVDREERPDLDKIYMNAAAGADAARAAAGRCRCSSRPT